VIYYCDQQASVSHDPSEITDLMLKTCFFYSYIIWKMVVLFNIFVETDFYFIYFFGF